MKFCDRWAMAGSSVRSQRPWIVSTKFKSVYPSVKVDACAKFEKNPQKMYSIHERWMDEGMHSHSHSCQPRRHKNRILKIVCRRLFHTTMYLEHSELWGVKRRPSCTPVNCLNQGLSDIWTVLIIGGFYNYLFILFSWTYESMKTSSMWQQVQHLKHAVQGLYARNTEKHHKYSLSACCVYSRVSTLCFGAVNWQV